MFQLWMNDENHKGVATGVGDFQAMISHCSGLALTLFLQGRLWSWWTIPGDEHSLELVSYDPRAPLPVSDKNGLRVGFVHGLSVEMLKEKGWPDTLPRESVAFGAFYFWSTDKEMNIWAVQWVTGIFSHLLHGITGKVMGSGSNQWKVRVLVLSSLMEVLKSVWIKETR